MSPSVRVVVSQRFAVPAESVFDAWLDPEWIGRGVTGRTVRDERVVRREFEPHVGGRISFAVERQGVEVDHVGKYLELDRPGLLVFTWTALDTLPDTSRLIVEIIPSVGGCDLTLTHVMSGNDAAFTDQAAGSWRKMLRALADELLEKNISTLNVS